MPCLSCGQQHYSNTLHLLHLRQRLLTPFPSPTMDRLPDGIMENILLQLPMEDLLSCAPKVCREWKDLIETSNRIQEKLFKRAHVASDEEWMHPWTRNPLTAQWFEWHADGIRGPIELADRDRVLRAPTSWRDMFIAKPAPSKVWLEFTTSVRIVHDTAGITIGKLADIVNGPHVGGSEEVPSRVILQ